MFWYDCRRIQFTPSQSIDTILPEKLFVLFVYPLRGVNIGNIPLCVVAVSRTIGDYRWQNPSQEIVRLVASINDRCPISYCARQPIVRSIVASDDRSYDQSLQPATTDRTRNRGTRRPIVQSIVGSNDRSHGNAIIRDAVTPAGIKNSN